VRTNNRPTINAVTAKTVLEGDTLRFTATASDPDLPNDTLSFSLGNPPTGATIAPRTGAFQWVPAFGQAGNYSVRVKVTDLAGASDSTTVSITVTHKNRPPTIAAVSAKTVAERDTLRFTVTATDPDLPNETLTYSLVNAPAWATIVSSTGVFQWVPAIGQAANYSVRIKVTDLAGASDSTAVSITVTQAVNHRPNFVTKMVDQTVNEGSTLTFTYTATDPDPGTTLAFSLLNPPSGATISTAGAFTFTPPSNPARTYAIVVLASDGSLADTARATVTVNRRPVINSRIPVSPSTVSRNVSQTFSVSATDPDGGALTYVWKLNGATDQSGSSNSYTKTFSDPQGTPKTIVCVASNPVGLKDSTTWSFTITGIGSSGESIPTEFALGQNYPNPFNPSTTLQYDLPKASAVTLEVFNVSGARIRSLLKGENIAAGRHTIVWDGHDESGRFVPSGAYIYRISAGDFQAWRKMTVLK
jgi:hypothetical protein